MRLLTLTVLSYHIFTKSLFRTYYVSGTWQSVEMNDEQMQQRSCVKILGHLQDMILLRKLVKYLTHDLPNNGDYY